jgi:hypothetical protein
MVTAYRRADLAAGGNSKPAVWQSIRQHAKNHKELGPAFPLLSYLPEPIATAQAITSFHQPLRKGSLARGQLHSEAMATFEPTRFEDAATVLRGHALAETVDPQPMTHFGLPCSFGHDRISFTYKCGQSLTRR